jgi:hypothetical protein
MAHKITAYMRDGETEQETKSRTELDFGFTTATAMSQFHVKFTDGKDYKSEPFNVATAILILKERSEQIQAGNLNCVEEMLMNQASLLQIMANKFAVLAMEECPLARRVEYSRLSMKAMSLLQATLNRIIQMKQPSTTTFVKQANIANGHQQVNNLENNSQIPQNKLLETQNGKWLDSGKKRQDALADTALEALGEIHRSKDTTG